MRENLFEKYGQFNHSKDLELCKSLLEKYRKSQQELEQNSNNQQQINKTLKTYPLAFNSYNLDKAKVKDNVKKFKEMRRTGLNTDEEKKDEKKIQEEKEKIMKKIFD